MAFSKHALSSYTKKSDHVIAIRKLLSGWNETESHGIPVGSAPARLLAEITINDVDQALTAHRIRYVRHVDDYRLFAKSHSQAFRNLAVLAQILYENHGLTLQPQKTFVHTVADFKRIFYSSPEDKELDELQTQFEDVLDELGISDPYQPINYDDLDQDQKELVDSLNLHELFRKEVARGSEPDLSVIKFILRRMGQLGDDSLVESIIQNLESIHPAYADIIQYFQNLRHLKPEQRGKLGNKLLAIAKSSIISELPYYRMWTFSVFTHSTEWDNEQRFQTLLNESSDHFCRREIILAMGRAKQSHWFQSQWRHLFDEPHWSRRALLAAASCMAKDARGHWYKSVSPRLDPLEKAVVKWAKDKPFA